MKNQKMSATQMDEIVFEHRNKAYGAYFLRKMYNKHLARALFMAIAILLAGLAYPLVNSYRTIVRARYIPNGGEVLINIDKAPPVETPLPPPPPPPSAALEKRVRFVPPVVVNAEVAESEGLPIQEDLNKLTSNIPVDDIELPLVVKKEETIHIEDTSPPEIFVQEMPEFPGGDAERQKFLADHISYPTQAAEAGITGTVYVQFVVDTKGNITDVKILRGIGGGCDEEALRVIKMMPQWHAGKQNGRAVRVLYNMPIMFKLQI
jgi:protein TonB